VSQFDPVRPPGVPGASQFRDSDSSPIPFNVGREVLKEERVLSEASEVAEHVTPNAVRIIVGEVGFVDELPITSVRRADGKNCLSVEVRVDFRPQEGEHHLVVRNRLETLQRLAANGNAARGRCR
jgi:hypothetical protein